MGQGPWWMERVQGLLQPPALEGLSLGALWRLTQALQFVRDNTDEALLRIDRSAWSTAPALWSAFVERETQVDEALGQASARVAQRVQRGELGPAAFRAAWETLGFATHADDAGTPADDFLDGLFRLTRLTLGEALPPEGSPNMASRAQRTADFLDVTNPGGADVVFDLGSGSGKLALTVGGSSQARVVGVECGASYVASARQSARTLGLQNVTFVHADVRDVSLEPGTVFYLYFPFRGAVARTMAQRLGQLARTRAITVYTSGPLEGYGEHFLREVDQGRLRLCERRGAFAEVLVLRSHGASQTVPPALEVAT